MSKPNPNWKAETDEAYRETAPTPLEELAEKSRLMGEIVERGIGQAIKHIEAFARAMKMLKGPRRTRGKKIRWMK